MSEVQTEYNTEQSGTNGHATNGSDTEDEMPTISDEELLERLDVKYGGIPYASTVADRIEALIEDQHEGLEVRYQAKQDEFQEACDVRRAAQKRVRQLAHEATQGLYDNPHALLLKLGEAARELADKSAHDTGLATQLSSLRARRQYEFHRMQGIAYKCVAGRLRKKAEAWTEQRGELKQLRRNERKRKKMKRRVERWTDHLDGDPLLFKAGPFDVFAHDVEALVSYE